MEFSSALKVSLVIGVGAVLVWLFRDDRLCRAEIKQQFGDVITIQHTFASTNYKFVPPAWRDAWRHGMPYPAAVTCWTDLEGVSGFTRH